MNRRRGQILAVLSLVATAALPVLMILVRMRMFTFHDDFPGFKALGFLFTWAFVLLAGFFWLVVALS